MLAARLLLLLFTMTMTTACRGTSGTRCDRVCRAEQDCAERLELPDPDRTGCVEACGELEREARTAHLVDEHIRCVSAATTCQALLDCP